MMLLKMRSLFSGLKMTESSITHKVDVMINKELKKNAQELSYTTIEPLSPEWPFSTNGLYFFFGKMGSGKTYAIMKHVLVSERLFDEPYYDTIVFTSTSGTLDKTVGTMKKDVRTPITYVKDTELMDFLKTHVERKMLFYAVMRFVNSGGTDVDDIMKGILNRMKPYRFINRGERVYDWGLIGQYLRQLMSTYGFTRYPSNTLLIMDDFAGHPLLSKVESPLARMLTKTRHYNITAILAVQTWRFVNLNFERLCTDIVIWKGFSEEDFKNMITQTPNDRNWRELWTEYSSLPSPHSHLRLHINASTLSFEP